MTLKQGKGFWYCQACTRLSPQASTDRFVPDACLFTPGSLTFDSLFEMAHHPIYSVHPRLVGKSQGDQSKTYYGIAIMAGGRQIGDRFSIVFIQRSKKHSTCSEF